jgi:ABC-type nitrate/sulfonate/bicarbonate transport system substrate-binding protein
MSGSVESVLRFSTTPFFNTRQFYHALETGRVSADGVDVRVEHNHSPVKDQLLVCGELDATTMSMGKYVTSKLVSHTDVVPTDPLAVAAGLTYERGNGMFVPVDGDVDDPADLAGARVGIHDTTLAMTYHKAILEGRHGVPPDDVEWVVDTHQRLGERFAAGELDAVERINDWYWTLRDGDDSRLLYDMAEEWQALHGYAPLVHLVAVDADLHEATPERVAAFVDALQAARDYRENHYDAVLDAFHEESEGGEYEGELTRDALEQLTGGVDCPMVLGDDQRQNVRDWMAYAERYGVFASAPIPDDRLFPKDAS